MERSGRDEQWVGLIGGLGVGSTVYYYQELVKAYAQRGWTAHLLIAHADMHRVMQAAQAGDRTGMAFYLAGLLDRLHAGGAGVGAVTAVMPHMCIRELTERSPIPLVSAIGAAAAEIGRRGWKRVALFGARYVVETRMFGQLEGVDVVMPTAEEIALIHNTYFQVAGSGASSAAQYQTFHDLAHRLVERGAEAIVFAGTDLALVFNERNTDFPYLDCAKVHVEALLQDAS